MTTTPYMRFYPGDWKQKTQHLPAEVRGVYLELILHIFANGALPDDDTALSRIGGVNVRTFRRIRPLLEPFFIMPGWRQVRAEEEREHSRAKSKKAIESINARWRNLNASLIEEKLQLNSPSDLPFVNPKNGETFEKTAEALYERIENSYTNVILSESESESERKKEAAAVVARGPFPTDEEVWNAMKDAGVTTDIMGPAMPHDLSPIFRLVHAGYDLHSIIKPAVRGVMAKRRSRQAIGSWDFFRPAVIEYARQAQDAAASLAASFAAGPIMTAPVRVKHALPVNWEPEKEDRDYAIACGLRVEELNSIRDDLRAWSSRGQVERDDWCALFRRKAETKARELKRMSKAEQAAIEEQKRATDALLDEAYGLRAKG